MAGAGVPQVAAPHPNPAPPLPRTVFFPALAEGAGSGSSGGGGGASIVERAVTEADGGAEATGAGALSLLPLTFQHRRPPIMMSRTRASTMY